jgi:ornithine cyclodeaminase
MQLIDAHTVQQRLPAGPLVAMLERLVREDSTTPLRQHHALPVAAAPDATLLLMPAWQENRYLGVKIATVFPGNAARGEPTVSAAYLLMDARTGAVQALIEGNTLTALRTAATSALAARYLARADASTLLVVGTGRVATQLAITHAAMRPALRHIVIWGRDRNHADGLVTRLRARGLPAARTDDLAAATATADIVSSATLATDPLIRGDWVRPGTHVDLVGGYTPAMREADDALIAKACVFVDTCAGALQEAGDIVQPVRSGILDAAAVTDLHALCRGQHPGRRTDDDITVFKSVGAALEDLAAAMLVVNAG